MKNWKLLTTFSIAGVLSFACSSDDGTGSSGDGDGDSGSGGVVVGETGGTGGGSTGGSPGTGGAVGVGGSTGGIGNTGGIPSTGGIDMGGAPFGGMGGDGPIEPTVPTVGCSGCAILHIPFTAEETGTDVELDLTADGLTDMSSTLVTVRVRVVMEGNAGGFQLYAKNGEPGYGSYYTGWTNFSDATDDFVEVQMDLGAIADPEGSFSKAAVRYIGINATTGTAWDGAMYDDVYLFIDSITFSDGTVPDLTFDANTDGIAINIYNSPVEGSELLHE